MKDSESVAPPESPYAMQLREGFARLRFTRALEREFRHEFAIHHQPRLRAGFGVAVVLYVLFTLVRLKAETGPLQEWGLVLRSIIIGSMLLTLLASYVGRLRVVLPAFAVLSYATLAIGVTAIEVLSKRHGVEMRYEGLILASFHLYVFSGLLFRPALVAGSCIVLT
ncbi:MAG: hypothetical protein ACRES8_03295 [Nevskiaceae bacterium]